jgi:DNA-binding response OmpR family regulator
MKKILLVEQDEDTEETLKEVLKMTVDCEIRTAKRPEELKKTLDASCCDYIIVDNMTMLVNGLKEVLKEKLKQDCKLIITSTLKYDDKIFNDFKGLKWKALLKKPFDMRDLQNMIRG